MDDLKALLVLYYDQGMAREYRDQKTEIVVGKICRNKSSKDGSCDDLNPADFYLALTNLLGKARRGMVIDKTFDEQIWNNPIVTYSMKYSAPSSDKKPSFVEVEGLPKALARTSSGHWEIGVESNIKLAKILPRKNRSNEVEEAVYRFILELNDQHQVVGGRWLSTAHPDFMTIPINFTGADRIAQELPPKSGEEGQKQARKLAKKGLLDKSLLNALVERSR